MANTDITYIDLDNLSKFKDNIDKKISQIGSVQSDWNVTDSSSDAYVKNKPKINGITLIGDKSTSDLGIEGSQDITQEDFDKLSEEEKNNGTLYCIIDANPGVGTKSYRNLSDKPSINGVELIGNKSSTDLGIKAGGVELTQAEYNALSEEEKKNGTIYLIKDGAGAGVVAGNVKTVGNSDVQTELDSVKTNINTINTNLAKLKTVIVTTNSDGIANPSPSISASEYYIVSAWDNGSNIVLPLVALSDNTWRLKILDASMVARNSITTTVSLMVAKITT